MYGRQHNLGRDSRKERVHPVFEHYCERFGLPKKGYQSFCTALKNKKGEYRWNDKKKTEVDKETQKEKQWLVWSDYMLKPICVVCGKIQDSKESEFIDMLTKGPGNDGPYECYFSCSAPRWLTLL